MTRIVVLFLLSFASKNAFSQEVDTRLIKNRGEKVNEMYKSNRNSYNYLLFELDSSYFIVDISTLTKEERKLIQKNSLFTPEIVEQINTNNFNYVDLGIQLSKEKRQYFKLNKEQVLVFYKVSELTQKFTHSTLNTK